MLPRWLPLYLTGIVALTLFPFLSPACEPGGWTLRIGLTDIVANTLAFVPIGLALRRLPLLGDCCSTLRPPPLLYFVE